MNVQLVNTNNHPQNLITYYHLPTDVVNRIAHFINLKSFVLLRTACKKTYNELYPTHCIDPILSRVFGPVSKMNIMRQPSAEQSMHYSIIKAFLNGTYVPKSPISISSTNLQYLTEPVASKKLVLFTENELPKMQPSIKDKFSTINIESRDIDAGFLETILTEYATIHELELKNCMFKELNTENNLQTDTISNVQLKKLTLNNCIFSETKFLQHFQELTYLKITTSNFNYITTDFLQDSPLASLQSLHIEHTKETFRSNKIGKRIPNARINPQYIQQKSAKLTYTQLETLLKQCPNVDTLTFSYVTFETLDEQDLSKFTQLRTLYLKECKFQTIKDFNSFLSAFPYLESFSIHKLVLTNDMSAIKFSPTLSKLVSVELYDNIVNDTVQNLTKVAPNLLYFKQFNSTNCCGTIEPIQAGGFDLMWLKEFKKLKYFEILPNIHISSGEMLEFLMTHQNINIVEDKKESELTKGLGTLRGFNNTLYITDQFLNDFYIKKEEIVPTSKYQYISASFSPISAKMLQLLMHYVKAAKKINISNCREIDNVIFDENDCFDKLETIYAEKSSLTEADCRAFLKHCPKLSLFDITDCPNISTKAIKQLETEYTEVIFKLVEHRAQTI